ncbi:MAG: twin-arginine translocase TatA/TatE family subunit [Candidatus Brocadiia bacterium]
MLAFFGPGGYEWIIILIVALLLFGKRLPEVMRSMGQGIQEFKKGMHDVNEGVQSAVNEAEEEELKELETGDSDSSPAG